MNVVLAGEESECERRTDRECRRCPRRTGVIKIMCSLGRLVHSGDIPRLVSQHQVDCARTGPSSVWYCEHRVLSLCKHLCRDSCWYVFLSSLTVCAFLPERYLSVVMLVMSVSIPRDQCFVKVLYVLKCHFLFVVSLIDLWVMSLSVWHWQCKSD